MQVSSVRSHLGVALLASLLFAACQGDAAAGVAPEAPPVSSATEAPPVSTAPDEAAGADEPGPPSDSEQTSPTVTIVAQRNQDHITALGRSTADFAGALYRVSPTAGNLAFSPYSIATALQMTSGGAAGETLAQMRSTLGVTLSDDDLHAAAQALAEELAGDSEGVELAVANRIWAEQQWEPLIRDGFRELMTSRYATGGFELVDFIGSHAEVRAEINRWVSERTREHIPELIPDDVIDGLTRFVLTNAVWFKGTWAAQFEEDATTDRAFTLVDGTSVDVPTMFLDTELRYADGEGYQAVTLPYEGRDFEMLVVLPDAGEPAAIGARIGAELVSEIETKAHRRPVHLYLPRFEFRWSSSLVDTLKALGMVLPFDDTLADFSRMADTSRVDGLYIGEVMHEAFVEVNEEGTEAAAATAVIMQTRGRAQSEPPPPVEVRVDRPFFFFIRHRATDTLLFVGRVVDPRSS